MKSKSVKTFNIFDALDDLEKEKGIPKDYMLSKIETALMTACKRELGTTNIKVVFNNEKKTMKVFQQLAVVENVEDNTNEITLDEAKRYNKRAEIGQIIDKELQPTTFRRLSATNAKSVIIQGIREAERGMLIKEYESKKEEIITATVLETDKDTGNVIVDTGTSRATILSSELIPGDKFNDGDHIKVFVTEVLKEERGPIVSLSRRHADMVKRLFELEVPEIQDGIVVIKSITREAGSRTKMAVLSRDENVDPIGACIGNRGMRINNIVSELNGEKIDIIKYSEDYKEYISAALSPAVVKSVEMIEEKSAVVIVSPDQLSLAIGKEGQNARLAARLTGCKIDIKTN